MTLECVDKENYQIYIDGKLHTSFTTPAFEGTSYQAKVVGGTNGVYYSVHSK